MVIRSSPQHAREVEEKVLGEVARHGYSDAATFAIKLALEEALTNAIRHGNRCDPARHVEVEFEIGRERSVIVITDQGEGFDLAAVPDPTADENLEKPHGRGIMLMRAYMDEVRYNDKGNRVQLLKRNQ
jgi:serine/threonine-protein kinase RsbW